jgi:hypothetical protein
MIGIVLFFVTNIQGNTTLLDPFIDLLRGHPDNLGHGRVSQPLEFF